MNDDEHDERTQALTPTWLSSVIVWWDPPGTPRTLAGPHPDGLPGDAATVHVLTSQDPEGQPQDADTNQRLLEDLLAWAATSPEVAGAALRWWPAVGAAADSTHAEWGIVVASVPRAEAAALGARLRQLAIYEVTAEELRIVRCRSGAVTETAPRAWAVRSPEVDLSEEVMAEWWRPVADALASGDR